MYDHHILIFGQNSLLLHGVPRIERPPVPSFCVLSQQNTYQASCILGESVSQRNFLVRDKKKFPSRCNTGKKYHSAVPHENSAFKNFIHTCLMLNSENISYILCKISHLLQSIAIIRHVSAQTPMPKRTISHRRLLFVHYPL